MIGRIYEFCRAGLGAFGIQVKIFPVAVSVLAASALLVGGRCTAMQWYFGLGICLVVSAWLRSWQAALKATVLMGGGLAFFWVWSGVMWINSWNDYQQCYMPAVRMLIEGWNPVYEATPERIAETLGLDVSTLQIWHVLSIAKSHLYFNAVAFGFTREPYNIMFPIYFFLFAGLANTIWVGFRLMTSRAVRLAMIAVVFFIGYGTFNVTDAVVMMAGIGLLTSIYVALSTRKFNQLDFLVYSFWMCTSKHSGMVACMVFWFLFVCIYMIEYRSKIIPCWRIVWALIPLVFIELASPYGAAYANYGHPLYPNYTVNEAQYPKMNLVGDFLDRNPDAAAMGHLGAAINAYCSSTCTQWYYNWRMGRKDFHPSAAIWRWHYGDDAASPTDVKTKLAICVALLGCLWLGDKNIRIVACLVGVGMLALPTPMIGYIRYVPWWIMLIILGLAGVGRWRWKRTVDVVLLLIVAVGFAVPSLLGEACRFEMAFLGRRMLRYNPPTEIFVHFKEEFLRNRKLVAQPVNEKGNVFRLTRANLELLKRESSDLVNTKIRELSYDRMTPEEVACYPIFFWDSIFRLAKEVHPWAGSRYKQIQAIADRRRRLLSYPLYIAEQWCCTLPRLIWQRIAG